MALLPLAGAILPPIQTSVATKQPLERAEAILNHSEKNEKAAITIQSQFRGHAGRGSFNRQKTAAVAVQASERGRASRKASSLLQRVTQRVRMFVKVGALSSSRKDKPNVETVTLRTLKSGKDSRLVLAIVERWYMLASAAVGLLGVTVAVVDAEPSCPIIGVAACVALLAVDPTEHPYRPHAILWLAACLFLGLCALLTAATVAASENSAAAAGGRCDPPTIFATCRDDHAEAHLVGLICWAALAAVALLAGMRLLVYALASPAPLLPRPTLRAIFGAVRVFFCSAALVQLVAAGVWLCLGVWEQTSLFVCRVVTNVICLALLGGVFSAHTRRRMHAYLISAHTRRHQADGHMMKLKRMATVSSALGDGRKSRISRESSESEVSEAGLAGRQTNHGRASTHWTDMHSVAALTGRRRSAAQTLTQGKNNFRGLPFGKLSREDFTTSKDTGLNQQVVRVALGEVDAFLSHSWSDSAEHKWHELARWAAEFTEEHKREPLVFLDKACIMQNAIDETLANLPIFVAGCNHFVVLAGATYTTRLWCLLEVFCFWRMGGNEGRLVLLPLPEPGTSLTQDAKAHKRILGDALERFQRADARSARCFNLSDREHLLGVIESGFGSVDTFNRLMSEAFSALLQTKIEAWSRWSKMQLATSTSRALNLASEDGSMKRQLSDAESMRDPRKSPRHAMGRGREGRRRANSAGAPVPGRAVRRQSLAPSLAGARQLSRQLTWSPGQLVRQLSFSATPSRVAPPMNRACTSEL